MVWALAPLFHILGKIIDLVIELISAVVESKPNLFGIIKIWLYLFHCGIPNSWASNIVFLSSGPDGLGT